MQHINFTEKVLMTRAIFISLLLLVSLTTEASSENYYFEKISPESGFAFDAVYTISEDCNGFVWFGCNNGLYYYNTSSIEKVDLFPKSFDESQSTKISKIYKDNDCLLWICAENGLFTRNTSENSFKKVVLFTKDSLKSSNQLVEDIVQYNSDKYLIVIHGSLYYFSKTEMELTPVKFGNNNPDGAISYVSIESKGNILAGSSRGQVFIGTSPEASFELFYYSKDDVINTICEDNNKYYIGYSESGIDVINFLGKKIYEMNRDMSGKSYLPDNRVREIIKTENGEIWVGTYQGILVVGKNENTLITSQKDSGLPHNSIYVLNQGKNNGIWVGTWAGGLAYFSPFNYRFNHIKKVPNENTQPKSVISAFVQDVSGNVWIGSEQAGIHLYNISENKFLPADKVFSVNHLERIKSFSTLNGENIFVGTFHQGVWQYNTKNRNIKKLGSGVLREASIISTSAYIDDELWIGTRGARSSLFKYDFDINEFKAYNLTSKTDIGTVYLRVWKLLFDSAQKLWICSDNGVFYKNKGEEGFHACFENDTIYKLNQTMIYTIFEDNNGEMWIGTKGKGLFRYSPKTDQLIPFTDNVLVPKSDVFGIVQDLDNNIWFSTDQGIFSYNKDLGKTTHYSIFDGISGNQYNPNAAYVCRNGEVFFGSSFGFFYINPKIIKTNTIVPEIFLSKILINNIPITEENVLKSNSLIATEIHKIKLNHDQNSLTFGIVANNFVKPEKNKFKYRLVNYEDDWFEVGQGKDITFTKVPPGIYTFEVLGSNNDNIWSKTPLSIQIEILAPIYQRWYAWLFYLGLFLFVVYIVIRETKLRMALRKQILSERYTSEARELVFAEKLRFFTNISHEIRTPLTLIISPLNGLIEKFRFDENTTKHLTIIKRNSQRLLRMTNQILDFRLLEVGKLKAHFKKTDVVSVCNDVFTCFEYTVKEKQINFLFNSNYKSLWITADADMIEKIVYNLVSNAIKFSKEKGQVFLTIESKELTGESYENYVFAGNKFIGKSIEIKVRDYGVGIKKDLLPNILERFVIDTEDTESGTGIGLHLCQEYAKLNNGNILVSSVEGEGTTFILNIPFQKNCEYEKKNIITQIWNDNNGEVNAAPDGPGEVESGKKVLLLAEDNDELRTYLKEYLSRYFRVLTVKNGQQAFEIANEIMPDILVTDILMPVLDGLNLVRKMKLNLSTSHIPIVVLTALSESKYQKESLMEGVDSFLTKPVEESLLLAQIENILTKRDLLKKRNGMNSIKIQDVQQPQSENSLIDAAKTIVEQNLRNADFNLEMLLDKLNVSRSTFHRKIKAASNQSPTEFIRDIRLKHAVHLMKTNTLNIDEIGTYVGFNSTSYFIRSFKKKYGKTPKEYYSGMRVN
jgi:signal transduction histidine kinase/ligand-binding sensor domain-containing protein/DNA-binding response OmpR family regulator